MSEIVKSGPASTLAGDCIDCPGVYRIKGGRATYDRISIWKGGGVYLARSAPGSSLRLVHADAIIEQVYDPEKNFDWTTITEDRASWPPSNERIVLASHEVGTTWPPYRQTYRNPNYELHSDPVPHLGGGCYLGQRWALADKSKAAALAAKHKFLEENI